MATLTRSDSNDDFIDDQFQDHAQTKGGLLSGKKEQKRRPKPKDGKVLFCGVCGDRALGYNFDAISCESCKAFFRRNALKVKPFVCSFEGNCLLDAHSRKFCSGCRLQKCFTIGMKKEWILDANQLQKRRQRQQTRRVHPSSMMMDTSPCTSTYGEPSQDEGTSGGESTIGACHSTSDFMDQMTTFVWSQSQPPHRSPPNNNNNNIPSTTSNLPEVHSSTSTYESSYSSLPSTPLPPQSPPPKAISFVYDKNSICDTKDTAPLSSSNDINHYNNSVNSYPTKALNLKRENSSDIYEDAEMQIKPLNPYIRENLDALCKKYQDIFDKPYNSEDTLKLLKQPKSMDQLYNMTDMFIRRLIRFTKCIPEFRSLAPDDQIGLLKGGIMELFVLRSCVSFDSRGGAFKFQSQLKTEAGETVVKDGAVKNSVMQMMGSSMFKNQMTTVRSIQELTGQDLTILILIFIIQLMDPNRPGVKASKLVAEAQDRHLTWLQAYLRSKNDEHITRMLLSKLMEKMEDVQELGKASCQMLMNVEIDRLEPLLIEIFDLG